MLELRFWILWGHGCLSLESDILCQVEVSATALSFVQRSPTECGVSLSEYRQNSISLDQQFEGRIGQNKKEKRRKKERKRDRQKDGYSFLGETRCPIFINMSYLPNKIFTSIIIQFACVSKSSNVICTNQHTVIFAPFCIWDETGTTWRRLLRRIHTVK